MSDAEAFYLVWLAFVAIALAFGGAHLLMVRNLDRWAYSLSFLLVNLFCAWGACWALIGMPALLVLVLL